MKQIQQLVILTPLLFSSPTAFAEINLKTSPLSAAIGISNVELDIEVADHWTIGPSFSGFNYERDNINFDSNALGVRANYYFGKALKGGWLVGMSAMYGDFTISEIDAGIEYSTKTSTRVYTALIEYQAMWKHFNMTFGIGASYFSMPSTVTGVSGVDLLEIDTSFLSGLLPNAEFTVGWKF